MMINRILKSNRVQPNVPIVQFYKQNRKTKQLVIYMQGVSIQRQLTMLPDIQTTYKALI